MLAQAVVREGLNPVALGANPMRVKKEIDLAVEAAIPKFGRDGLLPEGQSPATWEEIEARFLGEVESRRTRILRALVAWRDDRRRESVRGRLILDGSFVSARANPGDCDCLFVYDDSAGRVDARQETRRLTAARR